MKRLIAVILVAALSIVLATGAFAAYDPQVDYTSVMVDAAVCGDYAAGLAAEQSRNEKIDALGLNVNKFTFSDMMLLAKIMYAEAGSEWLSDEWKMCVGEVVLNRVASDEFPNTIAEVLAQPGQYYGANSSYFNNLIPSERCVRGAVRLLNGERLMDDCVVFQANFRQGGGVYAAYYDSLLGWTYFCNSTREYLYEEETPEAVPEQTTVAIVLPQAAAEVPTSENAAGGELSEFVNSMTPVA